MSEAGGRVWCFGNDIDTDALAPGLYMKHSISELARHCLETVDPDFAARARPGDVVVAGRNFGMGSSREQAVLTIRHLGIAAVLARSFAGIFYRNALNLGLLALVCPKPELLRPGDRVTVDGLSGTVNDLTTGINVQCEALPAHLVQMVVDGGLVPHLERRLSRQKEGR